MDKKEPSGMFIREYVEVVKITDILGRNNIRAIQLGLFGEVGSVMATAKKLRREKRAYFGYRKAVEEELGDVLWYFTALCIRFDCDINVILKNSGIDIRHKDLLVAATDFPDHPISLMASLNHNKKKLEVLLANLGIAAASILGISKNDPDIMQKLSRFMTIYFHIVQSTGIALSEIIEKNTQKVSGRFLKYNITTLPKFDEDYEVEEQLPQSFEIRFSQRKSGKIYLQWRGVFIGDPLTDNISDYDGYRYHDVFHLSYAAILHWSPVVRALLRQKRKSNSLVDENQDGGRAIVVEEGLTAWIFSQAKELDYFKKQERLSFELLKSVRQFVRGYEVQECPLNLWEHAILEGYKVFRKVRKNNGGLVIGDRRNRTIKFRE